ncbi:protein ANTAGONIST OF LIKE HETEROCHROMATIN PROTEIN 1 [Lingula anatina]|uniref:Putative nuclease HARBI1 n=1 Tax=Lingula anatina TaxID=7574 RepID=A0A1S3JAE4_LINAN|nr:protein ANTAGONIST OF LIKE HETEROCHROMATIN PROTEIN 1 [Lingula anatina]|eukprot:XP_013407293.1 protein ANTAGONIST OF LIKE HETEROCHROMATIN PROTEIN 1 [Lingula anatina]
MAAIATCLFLWNFFRFLLGKKRCKAKQSILRQPRVYGTRRRLSERRRRLGGFQRRARVHMNQMNMLAVTLLQMPKSINRNVWARDRGNMFWEHTVNVTFTEREWKENFRMSKDSFNFLCNILRPQLTRQETHLRHSITVEKQVAITLWFLGSGDSYRTISHLFAVGRSTVSTIVKRFVQAVVSRKNLFIKFPQDAELDRVIQGYANKWGFPNVGGAIDGTHIPIIAPPDSKGDYYNRKGWHSIQLQAVCNDRYHFTDIYIGWPGSVHDARVFNNSLIQERGMDGNLFGQRVVNLGNNRNVPVSLIGDAAYPLSHFLIKPFNDNGRLSDEQQHFNRCLSRARMTIENSFGRLKGRWRCLMKRLDVGVSTLAELILTCCILHNICEQEAEGFPDDWIRAVDEHNQAYPQPRNCAQRPPHNGIPLQGFNAGQNIRNALVQHLYP